VQHMVLASVDEGWSFGGSILTFLVPMLAFVAIAVTLLILYTKPELVPGRGKADGESPVTATRQPGLPVSEGQAPEGNGDGSDDSGASAGKSGEPVSAE
jgi:hypothetical protein